MRLFKKNGLVIIFLCVFTAIALLIEKSSGTSCKAKSTYHKTDSISEDSLQKYINIYCKLNQYLDSINKLMDSLKIGDSINVLHKRELLNEREKVKGYVQNLIPKLKMSASAIKRGKEVLFLSVKYRLYVADLSTDEIRIHLPNPTYPSNFGKIKAILESKNLEPLMITNAGMFTKKFEPEGLYIEENSKLRYGLDVGDQKSGLNFYLRPNGVFYLDNRNIAHIDTTPQVAKLLKSRKFKGKLATQSGPMLVINGRIHPSFVKGSKNYKIRSGVGLLNSKKVVFACTLDGSNFYDFALFLRDVYGCKNALFLDGAISKMYIKDIDTTENEGNFGPIISVNERKTK